MCGILTYLSWDERARIDPELFRSLNELHHHRGPDDGDVYIKDNVALGIRRLSIVDIKGGHQPMKTQDGRLSIVFNGEIYNHDALRQELKQKGCAFQTRSDTEVLMQAYLTWGVDCLKRLNGMFAFCIWDNQNKELFAARDRMGEKPLYYIVTDKCVMFSSELTPIYQSRLFNLTLNFEAISNYLAYWYICEPQTIFRQVEQLPPGHYALIRGKKILKKSYWQIPAEKEGIISFDAASEQLEALLYDAVKMRMKADVPLGTFLSGGIDSGFMTALAVKSKKDPLQSFSIGFKEKTYSELPEATLTAAKLGVKLSTTVMDEISPAVLEKIFQAFDEPLGNASFVPTYLLAQQAREHVKVVITGDGGDELFGGYPTYQAPYYQSAYRAVPYFMRNLIEKSVMAIPVSHKRISFDFRLKQLMKGLSLPYARAHYTWREVAPLSLQQNLFRKDIWQDLISYDPFSIAENCFQEAHGLQVKNQCMYVDLKTYLLNDHLRKLDRMTMAHSLEARLPFMDYRVVEFVMKLPSDLKVNLFETKRILKNIAKKYLPAAVISGSKKGLTPPIANWISHDLKSYMRERLRGGFLDEIFNRETIDRLLSEHDQRKFDHSRTLWAMLTLQGWSENLKKNNHAPELLSNSLKISS